MSDRTTSTVVRATPGDRIAEWRSVAATALAPAYRLLLESLRHLRALPGRYALVLVLAHLVLLLVVGPVIDALVHLAIDRAGLSNLTDRNVVELVSSPAPLLLVMLVATIVVVASVASYALVLTIADLQWRGARPSIRLLARTLRGVFRSLLHPESLLLAAHIVLLAPLVGFALFSPFTATIAVPPFVEREFLKTEIGALGWNLVAVVLLYVTYRTILTLAFVVVTGRRPARGFVAALAATGSKTGGKAGSKTGAKAGGVRLAALLSLTFAGTQLMWLLTADGLGGVVDLLSLVAFDDDRVIQITTIALSLVTLVNGVLFAFLFVGAARDHSDLELVAVAAYSRPGHTMRRLVTSTPAFLGLIALGATLTPAPATPADDTLVIAHRGYDTGGVENTISALDAAAALNADIVEVDIAQTGDGGLVATHDTNLLVLAGLDENVYEMTTAEVTSTTVTMRGNSDTIPTMADYVTRAAELDMPLLIELKVTGHESPGFVNDVLTELDGLGALEHNSFHSLDPAVVRKIQRLRPDLRVGLTIGLQLGDELTADCDFYVIEQSSYTAEFLESAHAAGRDVYVWTVNGALTMHRLLRDGVDGIVTDRISEADEYRESVDQSDEYTPGDALDGILQDAGWR